ncbi:MAG: hypothetical protein K2H09_06745, partial [Treponemataceae bacterium]|nr:hypothetical protein [Treponemataceae bacterium]
YILRPLLESGKVSTDEIEKLKDAGYCKIVFGLFIPMLIPYCGKTVYRYYSNPVSIHGKQYLLTNDWYEDVNRHNREPLLQWIAKYEDKKSTDL